MSVKWAVKGILEDLDYYIKGIPRFLFIWKDDREMSLDTFFLENVKKYPNDVAFIFNDEKITWLEADKKIDRYAAFLQSKDISKDQSFALLMDNCPDFLMLFIAANRIGAIAALINTTVTGEGLKHVISISESKAVICGASHLEKLKKSIEGSDLIDIPILLTKDSEDVPAGYDDIAIESKSYENPSKIKVKLIETAAYIFTSGTTGLPKAALVDHAKLVKGSYAGQFFGFNFKHEDIFYLTLPLYHSTGLLYGWGASLRAGCATIIKPKFSASEFWSDIKKHKATAFVYVGELLRYLMNNPASSLDKDHNIRVISGNGLRPDIWDSFQKRFGVSKIVEMYGATEAVGMVVNMAGRPGLIGRKRSDSSVIKCNLDSGEPILDSKGFCQKVKVGETGLYIQAISLTAKYQGYRDKQASVKKIMNDVFKSGDTFFNTGDLIKLHENNWLSFADRVGDTYRWKSENVSTMEVAAIVNKFSEVLDANVYGVEVKSAEGKAGMAMMNVAIDFDIDRFAEHVNDNLNAFQKPYFLKVTNTMQTTGTFKHQKEDLKKLGFNPATSNDPIFFLQNNKYIELNDDLYQKIQSGEERI
ncbi:MAG: AMP-binding protein [Gammaproteobacteria bacterium]